MWSQLLYVYSMNPLRWLRTICKMASVALSLASYLKSFKFCKNSPVLLSKLCIPSTYVVKC